MKPSPQFDELQRSVARKVLTESLALKKSESLTIETWNNGLAFARHLVLEARRIGAVPLTVFEDEDAYVEGVPLVPKDVLGKMGRQEYRLISGTDAYVFIPGPVLGSFSHRLPRERLLASLTYGDAWYKAAAKAKLRGVRMAFGYIGEDAPSLLGRSIGSIVTHQLRASLVDFAEVGRRAKRVLAALPEGGRAVVKTPGSELSLSLAAAREVDDGVVDEKDLESENNVCYMPPGFVYAEVDPGSVSGTFSFAPTVTRFGMIKDGTLEFKDGRVASWRSGSSAPAFAKLAAAAAEGARRATAVTVGLNPLLKYGYGQNGNSAGVIGLRALGVSFTTNRASLAVEGKALVSRGRL